MAIRIGRSNAWTLVFGIWLVCFRGGDAFADGGVGLTFDHPLFSAPFGAASTQDWIAISHTDGHVVVFDRHAIDQVETNFRIFRPPVSAPREASRGWRVALRPDDSLMAVATPRNEEGTPGSAEVFFVPLEQRSAYSWQGIRRASATGTPNQISFTPDGRYLIVGHDGGSSGLDVLDVETTERLAQDGTQFGNVRGVAALNSAGIRLAGTSTGWLHSVRIVEDGPKLESLDQQAVRGPIVHLAAHPAKPWVAVGYRNKHLHDSKCEGRDVQLVIDIVEIDLSTGKLGPTIATYVAPENTHLKGHGGQRLDRVSWSSSGNHFFAAGYVWRDLGSDDPDLDSLSFPPAAPSFPYGEQLLAQGIYHWDTTRYDPCPTSWLGTGADGVMALVPFGEDGIFAATRDPAYAAFDLDVEGAKWTASRYWPPQALDLRHQFYRFAVSPDLKRTWIETTRTDGRLIRFDLDAGIAEEIGEERFAQDTLHEDVINHIRISEDTLDVHGWKVKQAGLLIDVEPDTPTTLKPQTPRGIELALDYDTDERVRGDRYRSMHPLDDTSGIAARVLLGSYNFLRLVDIDGEVEAVTPLTHTAHRLAVVENSEQQRRTFIAAHDDGIIRYYTAQEGLLAPYLNLAIERGLRDWVVWSPTGFFYGVGQLVENINFNGLADTPTTIQNSSLDEVRWALNCKLIIFEIVRTGDEVAAVEEVLQDLREQGQTSDTLKECTILRDLWDKGGVLTPELLKNAAEAVFLRTALQIVAPAPGTPIGGSRIDVKVSLLSERVRERVHFIRLSIKGATQTYRDIPVADVGQGAVIAIPEDLRCNGATLTIRATPLDQRKTPVPGFTSRSTDVTYRGGDECRTPSVWAVILGENYDDVSLPNVGILRGAENDARGMLDFFCSRLGASGDFSTVHTLTVGFLSDDEFEEYRRRCLSDVSFNYPSFLTPFTTEAVRAWLERAMAGFVTSGWKVGARDIIVIYAAGHGYQDEGAIYYIAPRDLLGPLVERRDISLRELLPNENVVQNLPSGAKMFGFFDACRRGGADLGDLTHAVTASDLWRDTVSVTARNQATSDIGGIFLASKTNSPSWEGEIGEDGRVHGIFTAALLEGLSGWADSARTRRVNHYIGFVETGDLSAYLQCRVTNLAEELPDSDAWLQEMDTSYNSLPASRLTKVLSRLTFGRAANDCVEETQ